MHSRLLIFSIMVILLLSCTSEQNKNQIKLKSESKSVKVPIDSFYCYAKGILKDKNSIKFQFDKIEYFQSDIAYKEMLKDGLITENEMPPNNIYIRNNEESVETALIDSSTSILMQTLSYDELGNFSINEKINIDEFTKLLYPNYERNFINYPFLVKIKNNKIIQIKEEYIP